METVGNEKTSHLTREGTLWPPQRRSLLGRTLQCNFDPKLGWKLVKNQSSLFWHPTLKVLLMVYVDDFKMAGDSESLQEAWKGSMKHMSLKGKPKETTRCLGCNRTFKDTILPNGPKARRVSWGNERLTATSRPILCSSRGEICFTKRLDPILK